MSTSAPEPTPGPVPDAPAPQSPPEAVPAPAAPPARPSATEPSSVEQLPDFAQKLIRDLRKEAADNRGAKTTAEQERQQLLDGIATALGIKSNDAPPDPQVLQQTLTEREGRIGALEGDVRARDLELAAWRAASTGGANAAALLDSRSFVTQLAKLDPAADDFTKQIDAAVKTALDANPTLRAAPTPTPGQAGIGVTGGGGTPIADMPARDLLRNSYGRSQ